MAALGPRRTGSRWDHSVTQSQEGLPGLSTRGFHFHSVPHCSGEVPPGRSTRLMCSEESQPPGSPAPLPQGNPPLSVSSTAVSLAFI